MAKLDFFNKDKDKKEKGSDSEKSNDPLDVSKDKKKSSDTDKVKKQSSDTAKIFKDSKTKNDDAIIKDKVEINFEPNIGDDIEDIQEMINEVMSIAGRLKRKQQIRRYKSKMKIARKRSLKRRANQSTIAKRAKRSSINNMKRKLSGGRSSSKLTMSDRARVERLVKRRSGVVNRNARRLVIQKRVQERKRLSNRR